jgi:hypothetical protein
MKRLRYEAGDDGEASSSASRYPVLPVSAFPFCSSYFVYSQNQIVTVQEAAARRETPSVLYVSLLAPVLGLSLNTESLIRLMRATFALPCHGLSHTMTLFAHAVESDLASNISSGTLDCGARRATLRAL